MCNGPISLGGNDDYGSISRRSSPCISTKSLPLDESGYPSDGSTSCSTDSPHILSHSPSNQNTPNDPALRMRSESIPMSDSLVDGVSGRLLTDKLFLCPANTPAVEFSTLPVQISLPQTNGVSVSTPDLSLLSADLYQSNATAVADERIHQHSPIPPEDIDLEESLFATALAITNRSKIVTCI
jgi:hypothetical protein